MAAGGLDALEGDLKDQLGLDDSHGTKTIEGVTPDEGIDFVKFRIGETGISLRERDELLPIEHGKGEVGEEAGTSL